MTSGWTNTSAPFRLVRIERERLDEWHLYGFVVSTSPHLLILHQLSDRYDLDGYRCVRRVDISALDEEFERRDLIERALRLKGLSPQSARVAARENMREMMHDVQREYGLLTIHREDVHPDECEIGEIRMSFESTYVLKWLDPDARWETDDRAFRYSDVTRLDFDGEYERTLLMVSADRDREP
jgi:hypothetical protein